MIYDKTCKRCQRPFLTYTKNQLFCRRIECRPGRMRYHEKTIPYSQRTPEQKRQDLLRKAMKHYHRHGILPRSVTVNDPEFWEVYTLRQERRKAQWHLANILRQIKALKDFQQTGSLEAMQMLPEGYRPQISLSSSAT